MSNLKMILIACAVSLLAACGGGDSGSSSTPAPYVAPATYGAIVVNVANQGGTYVGYNGSYTSSNRTSQVAANTDALVGCQTFAKTTNCVVALEFGQNQCGSIALSYVKNTGVYATGSGSSGSIAEASAISACTKNGGSNCSIPTCDTGASCTTAQKLTLCNGSGSTAFFALPNGTGSSSYLSVEDLGSTIDVKESK